MANLNFPLLLLWCILKNKTELLFKIFLTIAIAAFPETDADASPFPFHQDKTVNIGLLIPDNKSIAAMQGAEIAIREANAEGGLNGTPFRLVTRSMEGPWGTGSKEAVNLVFEEHVWAILGSHDGRNAHLVEQVAAKTHVVFLSAWASDPTLSLAFIPWYFSCVPNDLQQSNALIEEIYNKRRFENIAVVNGDDYDSKLSSETFLKRTKLAGKPDPLRFSYGNSSQDLNALLDNINKTDVKCIVLFGQPSVSLRILRQIREKKMNQPVFGSLLLLNENELSHQELLEYDNVILIPSGLWPPSENSSFSREFQETYKRIPGVVASYAYDGMNLLIEAIRKAGAPDREKIQKSLQNIYYDGVTGLIRFDDKGNRIGNFKVTGIKNRLPAAIE